jgi:PAS domain-containing protein
MQAAEVDMPLTTDFHLTVFEAIPSPIFVVDRDLCIIDFNAAAARLPDPIVFTALRPGAGEVLHCINAEGAGCGASPACRECGIRNSMREALQGGYVCRHAVRLHVRRGEQTIEEADFLVTAAPFRDGSESLLLLILEDLEEIVRLRDRSLSRSAHAAGTR